MPGVAWSVGSIILYSERNAEQQRVSLIATNILELDMDDITYKNDLSVEFLLPMIL